MILDTSFLIDLMRGDMTAVRKLDDLEERRTSMNITAPTLFELWSGFRRSRLPEVERQHIESVLAIGVLWPLDVEAAVRGGLVDGLLLAQGKGIEPVDAMIAGIALCRGEPVITRNADHFSRVEGLQVEQY
ncbi:MAG: PIN domain-containing protein [Candidatus Aenigmarchaeota archaeon]|nr:PIN domain-containing protein [Candidatus Aenigmarchaeota archaeon]